MNALWALEKQLPLGGGLRPMELLMGLPWVWAPVSPCPVHSTLRRWGHGLPGSQTPLPRVTETLSSLAVRPPGALP